MPKGLSIVIPAWNEEGRLPKTLEKYLPMLAARGGPFEVLVVVDGAHDRTAEIARSYAPQGVRVMEFTQKLGKGGAVLRGMAAAQYDIVGYLDADGPVPPEEIVKLLDALPGVDGVVASRWMRESVVTVKQSLFRRFYSRIWNFFARSVLLLPLKDTQCGAKFFRREMIQPILASVTLTNWAFDVDLLYHVRKVGASMTEVPVTWAHDTDSKLPVWKAVPVMMASIIGVRLMNLEPIARRVPKRLVEWFLARYGTT
ncbi:MAG: glycosyltransferase family 2 protein [Thermoplasmata archaeon]|nr:glycosyltransferase family 2 protein [Thermoplasmata archaeon]